MYYICITKYFFMSNKFKLSGKSRDYLRTFKTTGGHSLREFNRATILLFLDKGLTISQIEDLLEVDRTTIWRIKKRYPDYGLEMALTGENRSGQPLKYTTCHEAEQAALACGPVPEARRRWTIRLLAEQLNKKKRI